MVFGRRHKLPVWQRVLGWLWPRSGLRRAWLYIWHRIARLPGSTHSIAAGFASGAAVSFTPFIGLHFLMGFGVAWLTRGNLVASAIGTAIGNPWTFPFIFALTGKIGSLVLGETVTTEVPVWNWDGVLEAPIEYLVAFLPIIFPLLVGSVPAALTVWLLFYFGFKGLIVRYRKRRQERLEAKLADEDYRRRRDAILAAQKGKTDEQ